MSYPTFSGRHNRLKYQCWSLLADYRESNEWITSARISDETKVNLHSLRTALTKWCRSDWRRVLRRKRNYLYEYRLSFKGLKWVEAWARFVPRQQFKVKYVKG